MYTHATFKFLNFYINLYILDIQSTFHVLLLVFLLNKIQLEKVVVHIV